MCHPSVGAAVLEPQRKPDHALEKESVMFYYTTVSSVGFFVNRHHRLDLRIWRYRRGCSGDCATPVFLHTRDNSPQLIMGMVIRKRRLMITGGRNKANACTHILGQ